LNREDKQAFANEAEKALDHELVQSVWDEAWFNWGRRLGQGAKPLFYYTLAKVSMYTAIAARAQALGIDLQELKLTPDEAAYEMGRKAAQLLQSGTPVLVVGSDCVVALTQRDDERGVLS